MSNPLLDPIRLGAIEAPNRILMAPLTRGRSDPGSVPNALMVEYYRQRAGAGLILTEATGISVEGLGWPAAPGIWNAGQTEAWKPVTEAVHQAGGANHAPDVAHGTAGPPRFPRRKPAGFGFGDDRAGPCLDPDGTPRLPAGARTPERRDRAGDRRLRARR